MSDLLASLVSDWPGSPDDPDGLSELWGYVTDMWGDEATVALEAGSYLALCRSQNVEPVPLAEWLTNMETSGWRDDDDGAAWLPYWVATVAAGIRAVRGGRGLSQTELAELSGVNQSTLSRLEHGLVDDVKLSTIVSVAVALNVSVVELFDLGVRFE